MLTQQLVLWFVTLWTLDRTRCIVAVDQEHQRFDLKILDEDVVLLEQHNISIDDVMTTALSWRQQYAGARLAGSSAIH